MLGLCTRSYVEGIKDPKPTIKDVYDKIIYDTVRRDKEIDYKPIYIGKREAKQNEEQTLQKKNDDEIMKMHFAERRFKGNA